MKKSILWESDDKEEQGLSNAAAQVAADTTDVDLQSYLLLPPQPRDSDPIERWVKQGRRLHPVMFEIAMKYLSLPATSVPSKRIFSTAGGVVTKKRNRLGEGSMWMLICLYSNLRKWPFKLLKECLLRNQYVKNSMPSNKVGESNPSIHQSLQLMGRFGIL